MSRYEELTAQFYGNRRLFGDPAEAGIVAVEIASPTEVEIFRRAGADAAIARDRRPVGLFALLSERALLEGLRVQHQIIELAGDFHFRYLATFASTHALEAARRHLRAAASSAATSDAPWLILADPVAQHLMITGATCFRGLQFDDLRRMQLDIETYIGAGFEFPSAARESDRIIAIALRDNTGFERVLTARDLDERAMLAELVRIVAERDPDVIEGHNLFRFDLEYLEARAPPSRQACPGAGRKRDTRAALAAYGG